MIGLDGGPHDRLTEFTHAISGAYYFVPSAEDLAGFAVEAETKGVGAGRRLDQVAYSLPRRLSARSRASPIAVVRLGLLDVGQGEIALGVGAVVARRLHDQPRGRGRLGGRRFRQARCVESRLGGGGRGIGGIHRVLGSLGGDLGRQPASARDGGGLLGLAPFGERFGGGRITLRFRIAHRRRLPLVGSMTPAVCRAK